MQDRKKSPEKKYAARRHGLRLPVRADGYVIVDSQAMESLRLERGLSVRQMAAQTGVSPTTLGRFFAEQPVQIQSVRKVFANLGISDIVPYLLQSDPDGQRESDLDRDADVLAEWKIENLEARLQQLSNGLSFQVAKLAHRVMPNTFARGKRYDLSLVRTRDQERVREQLLRHPTVCRQLIGCPHIPVNERVLFSEDRSRFWVIDSWCDGISLEDKLRYGPLPATRLAAVMRQILSGLDAMHAAGIVRRELSPRYIFLTEPTGDVLLTELELAKLLVGVRSVSETWDEDPYRAPEVEAAEVDQSVDLFSWAQVLLHTATGSPPPSPADAGLFDKTSLPAKIQMLGERCLSPNHLWRPQSVGEILEVVDAWENQSL